MEPTIVFAFDGPGVCFFFSAGFRLLGALLLLLAEAKGGGEVLAEEEEALLELSRKLIMTCA